MFFHLLLMRVVFFLLKKGYLQWLAESQPARPVWQAPTYGPYGIMQTTDNTPKINSFLICWRKFLIKFSKNLLKTFLKRVQSFFSSRTEQPRKFQYFVCTLSLWPFHTSPFSTFTRYFFIFSKNYYYCLWSQKLSLCETQSTSTQKIGKSNDDKNFFPTN